MKFIAALLSALVLSATASAQTPAIETAGVDHIGINVPNLAEAGAFLSTTFGCKPVTLIGPFKLTSSLSEDRTHQVAARADSVSIAMLRCGTGSNIELFEYKNSTGSTLIPNNEDLAASHIAFYTDDVQAGAAYLKSRGITVFGEPMKMESGDTAGETWVHFRSPWGSEMELVGYPKGKAYEKSKSIKLWDPKHPNE
ncbi:4-hydroxyphenylpyruvate dioxygenase [Paraburkholderia sp. JPY303]|uniref:VOC family protein n=1 Tax=Paraburkholderia atlantica TaxID=2654982 RepID=UPI00158FC37E|nr:VOC family protein [Paraburkholderia atlantica]NUY33599.1 4-hydroxyphenylpyruvate dioxygenase [Paraburkholderia atlantica]